MIDNSFDKLTIIIPTFNRARFLDLILSTMVEEISSLDSVSILVVDGCSTDTTQEVCTKYSNICSSFRSILLEEKGGVDKDIDIGVMHSTSEYCWLFCDDDSIMPGSVRAILEEILTHEPDLMIINSSLYDFNMDDMLLEKSIDINSDVIIENKSNMQDILFETCKTYLGFSGALLFKRKNWCNIDSSIFYGNRFSDMCTIGKFPQSSKVVILHHPYILIRLGNAEWSEISFKVWYEYYPSAIKEHSILSDRVIDILVPDTLIWNLKFLLWYRATDSYKVSQYKAFMKNKNCILRTISLLILLLPPISLRLAFLLRAILKKDKLVIYNLTKGRVSQNEWKSES